MRIIIDMQGAQTASRFRGIGRVCRNLTESIIHYGAHDVHLALNGLLPEAIDELREQFGPLLPQGHIHVWQAVPPTALLPGGSPLHHEWASTIYAEFLASLCPDVVLLSSLMECSDDNFFCDPTALKGKCLLASVVYDFIPLKDTQKYLNAVTAPRYEALLQRLRQMDVVFPISSFVRKECAAHLPGVPAQELALRADGFFWERCAGVVMETLEGLVAKHSASWPQETWHNRLERICRQLSLPTNCGKDVARLADALALTFPRPRQPQLLVDVGVLAGIDSKTGIQRVVRGIAMELVRNPPDGWLIRFVRAAERRGYYVYAHEAALKLFGYNDGLGEDMPIEYGEGDIFLGLDLTIYETLEHTSWLDSMHRYGVRMYFVVYDIIPLIFKLYVPDGISVFFEDWMRTIIRFDGLVCISASVAEEVRQWIAGHDLVRSSFEVSSFHLGAEVERTQPTMGLPEDAATTLLLIRERPSILVVSTIEPRKRHRQILAAMDMLWSEGVDANLVFVGKSGWKMDDFEATLRSHHENGDRLFWLRGISDEYLTKIYEASTVLLSASEAEGFGLSIIEAARYGKPLILRDIPVFREVAGDHAFYFSGLDAKDLADALRRWLDAYAQGVAPSSTGIRWSTWQESCQSLLSAVGIIGAASAIKPDTRVMK